MLFCFRLSAVAVAIAATSVCAQSAVSKVEPVVVTAARSAELLAETLRDVTVLRGEALESAGVTDLTIALQSVAGIEVVAQGAGATPSIFVRGGNSNQVLILIDGQRVGSSFSGLSALQHVPISQIDRIEIVRGPAASLYGADAVSGVIQIFTRRDGALAASAKVGEQGSSEFSARAGLARNGNSFAVAASHRESRGFNAIVDPSNFSFNPDRDGYRFSSAHLAGSLTLSPTLTLDASALVARGNAQYDGSANFDDRIKSNMRNLGTTLNYRVSKDWNTKLSIGQSVDQSEFVSSFPGDYKTTQEQAAWQNNWRVNAQTGVWGALEWRREKISALDAFAIDSRRTASAALGGEYTSAAMKVNASIRIDDSSQYDTRATGNIGFAYSLSREWRVIANAGSSFKAPTFNDLYFPGFSSPKLAPEKGKNVEVAVAWASGSSTAKLVVYDNRVRDLIQFVCDASFNCAPQNVARAEISGATLTGSTRLSGLNVEGSIDLANPKDVATEKRLARRAKVHGALKISGTIYLINSGVELVASGDRFDNASNTRRLSGYGTVNAFASFAFAPGMTLGLRVDNAFDRDYQLSRGYANGGRRSWLTLSINNL